MPEAAQRPAGPGERLRTTPPAARARAYREIYEETLARVLADRPRTPQALECGTNRKTALFIRRSIGAGRAVLEIGCGFGSTALIVGGGQREMVGVDASPTAVAIAAGFASGHPNIRFAAMDASRLEFPEASFDAAYSVDLIEHLHPDDLPAHLREVHRVLRPGGFYLIKTPSELTGPHEGAAPGDPACLHLREYRYGTLLPLLAGAGFERAAAPAFSMRLASRLPGRPRLPARLNLAAEAVARLAPEGSRLRRRLARSLGVKQIVVLAVREARQ